MKIKFDEYEVEIKAKGITNLDKYTEHDTLCFLNHLSCILREASQFNDCQGARTTSKCYYETASNLFKICDEKGLYNK